MKLHAMKLPQKLQPRTIDWIAVAIYIVLPWLVFGLGYNLLAYVMAPGDASIAGYPNKLLIAEQHLWSPYSTNGTFLMREGVSHQAYPPALLIMNLFPNPFGYNLLLFLHYSLAGIFTYFFLKQINAKQFPAFLGGALFMFSGFMSAHLGHHNMVIAATWLPAVLLCVERYIQKRNFLSLFLAAVAFSFSITGEYWAMPMYIGMIALPYIAYRCVADGKVRAQSKKKIIWEMLKMFVVVFIGGLLLCAFYIAVIYQSLAYTGRTAISYEEFASYGFPAYMLPMQVFPFAFLQDANVYLFYGPWNITELFGYMPIFSVIFAISAFVFLRKKNSQVWFWALIALFAFILVLGDSTPFYKLAFKVPLYNIFRAPARNWYEVNFAIAILAALGLNAVWGADGEKRKQMLKTCLKVTAGVAVCAVGILLVLFSLRQPLEGFLGSEITLPWFTYNMNDIAAFVIRNFNLANPSFFLPLVWIAGSAVILLLIRKFGFRWFVNVSICALVFLDIFSYAHYIVGRPSPPLEKPSTVAYIEEHSPEKAEYRVFATDMGQEGVFPMGNTFYDLQTINSYTAVPLADYVQLTGFYTNGTVADPAGFFAKNELLSSLGTKYIVTGDEQLKKALESVRGLGEGRETVLGEDMQFELFLAEEADGAYHVASSPGEYSLIQASLELEPDTYYKITFDVKTDGASGVVVDLFADGYDNAAQQREFSPSSIGTEYQENSVLFYSGDAPEQALVRVMTFDGSQAWIKDIRVEKVTGEGEATYGRVFEDENGNAVYENRNVLPRAWFVEELTPVSGIDEVNGYFSAPESFVPAQTALVEGVQPQQLAEAEVTSADYSGVDDITINVNVKGDKAFLVLSDTYYTGWEVYVDGQRQTIYKTNGVMRGVFVEGAGEHTVEYRFFPRIMYAGLAVTLVTAGVFTLISVLDYRKRKRRADGNGR